MKSRRNDIINNLSRGRRFSVRAAQMPAAKMRMSSIGRRGK